MTESSALTLFFLQIWRLFQLESPFFGLTFAQIAFGLLVCEMGIGILADLFVSLFDTSASSQEQRIDDYNRRHARVNRYVYYRRNFK